MYSSKVQKRPKLVGFKAELFVEELRNTLTNGFSIFSSDYTTDLICFVLLWCYAEKFSARKVFNKKTKKKKTILIFDDLVRS